MKKYLISFVIGLALLAAPAFVSAQNTTTTDSALNQQLKTFAQASGAGEQEPTDPRIVVAQIIKLMFGVVGIMFFAYSVYAGFIIMTSSGDDQKVKKGKDTLRTGVIGIFVAMSAYSILTLVSETALKSTQDNTQSIYIDYDSGNQGYQ